jgi:hypothetical protein
MANSFLGEVTVQGGDKTYTLRCDFNAMAEFETETGKDAMETFADFEKGKVSVKTMIAMMWAFMRRHHPDTTLTDAGDLLSTNMDALQEVMEAAMPKAVASAAPGKAKPRRKS